MNKTIDLTQTEVLACYVDCDYPHNDDDWVHDITDEKTVRDIYSNILDGAIHGVLELGLNLLGFNIDTRWPWVRSTMLNNDYAKHTLTIKLKAKVNGEWVYIKNCDDPITAVRIETGGVEDE